MQLSARVYTRLALRLYVSRYEYDTRYMYGSMYDMVMDRYREKKPNTGAPTRPA